MKILSSLLGVLFCGLSATVLAAEVPVAGTASTVVGQVSAANSAGLVRPLGKDNAVYSGERILTGPTGYVRLSFLDGGTTVLRPNSEFEIVSFRFQPSSPAAPVAAVKPAASKPAAPSKSTGLPALQVSQQAGSSNQAFFRLIRGGFRAVSGLVGKISREEYSVRTPVATIGIRGTTFLSVVCDISCVADPDIQDLLPPGEVAQGGVVTGVDEGSIVATSSTGQVVTLNAVQYILTTATGLHIKLLKRPAFLSPEHWLESSTLAAASPPASSPPPPAPTPSGKLLGTSLSTTPIVGAGAAVLLGAVVLITDAQDGSSGTAPVATTTSTSGNR